MNKETYMSQKTFEKFDNKHYVVYLNEEIIPDFVPPVMEGRALPDPVTGYAYTGQLPDGGTLIESADESRDNLINGIIRSKYSQSEEDAIKTHQIIRLTEKLDSDKLEEYKEEWNGFNAFRDSAKATVDRWLSE